jgi:hypothetical protein
MRPVPHLKMFHVEQFTPIGSALSRNCSTWNNCIPAASKLFRRNLPIITAIYRTIEVHSHTLCALEILEGAWAISA